LISIFDFRLAEPASGLASKIENRKPAIVLTVVGETIIMLALSAMQVGLRHARAETLQAKNPTAPVID
jgi:hypothetical protein